MQQPASFLVRPAQQLMQTAAPAAALLRRHLHSIPMAVRAGTVTQQAGSVALLVKAAPVQAAYSELGTAAMLSTQPLVSAVWAAAAPVAGLVAWAAQLC